MKICVYCASSAHIDETYFEAAEKLAHLFVDNDVEMVFGGGAEGLMGKLADVMCDRGGKVKGIMPHFMKEVEWAHPKVKDFHFVETMAERKAEFLIGIDALVTLPGGTGTLEELFEAITLKRLGKFTKPIVILNTNDYYSPLIDMLQKTVDNKFMSPRHLQMWSYVNTPEEVLSTIRSTPDWEENAINYATLKQADI